MYRHFDPNGNYALEGSSLRTRVKKFVHADIEQAYSCARSIKHPWFRCQALAIVAENASKTYARSIIIESFESAKNCHDENRRVSVARWPLMASIKMDYRDLSEQIVDYCSEQLSHDIEPIWKWCAISIVHAIKLDTELLEKFYATFVCATEKGHGWKVEKRLRNIIRDDFIRNDQRYIEHAIQRLNAIQKWKCDNASKGSS